MFLVDNNILVTLGASQRLDLLRHFQPLGTTTRVHREHRRIASEESVRALEQTRKNGWLVMIAAPAPAEASRYVGRRGLSMTDAELLVLAKTGGHVLLTDERALYEVADTAGVATFNLPDLLLNLKTRGILVGEPLRRAVADFEYGPDARTFTPAQRESLGL